VVQPLQTDAGPVSVRTVEPMEQPVPDRSTILVVDDDPSICRHLAEALAREGYASRTCQDPQEALRLARTEAFDLAFVDIRLPGMSGLDLAAQLREEDPEREVVFITGYGSFESVLAAIKIGAYDYLRKPFNLNELNLCLRRFQERRELKAQVRRAERRYFDLVQNMPLLIWVLGWDLELEFVNEACESLLGFPSEEAMGTARWFLERVHPADRFRVRRDLKSAFDTPGHTFSTECRLLHRNGHIIHAILKSLPQGEGAGDSGRERIEGVVVDITDRVLLEKTVVQREKLKTLGAISAEVAHEIRNPLMSIGGFARRLQQKQPDLAEGEIILKESARLERILDRIRNYLQPVDLRPRPCSINDLIRSSSELLVHEFERRGVECILALDDSMPEIQADPDILTEILINLIRNALDAMDWGEALAIGSSESEHHVQATVRSRVPDTKFQNLEELLLPFDEGGEHLGLPFCYKMLRNMGGLLSSERERDEMAFTISLPKSAGRGDTPGDPAASPKRTAGPS